MDDQDYLLACAVDTAAEELNIAIRKAADAGLQVRIEVEPVLRISPRGPMEASYPGVDAFVARPISTARA